MFTHLPTHLLRRKLTRLHAHTHTRALRVPIAIRQCLFAPICVLFLTGNVSDGADATVPDWAIAIMVGAGMTLVALVTLPSDRPPVL